MNSFPQRKSPVIFAVVATLLIGLSHALPGEPGDPLDRKVANHLAYSSVDEALDQLSKTTGLKVACPEDTKALLRKVWAKHRFVETLFSSEETIRSLIKKVSFEFGLAANFSPEDGTIHMDIPWRATDSRSTTELLHSIWDPDHSMFLPNDPKWQDVFDALLCKEGNFEKARTVRQTAYLDSFALLGTTKESLQPRLRVPIVNTAGEKYVFFLFCRQVSSYPGHGTATYYWFKEDGTLAGTGMMNTGNRCALATEAIDNDFMVRQNKPSELQMVFTFNRRSIRIARYALEDAGLKLTHFTDATGKEIAPSEYDVGQSCVELAK